MSGSGWVNGDADPARRAGGRGEGVAEGRRRGGADEVATVIAWAEHVQGRLGPEQVGEGAGRLAAHLGQRTERRPAQGRSDLALGSGQLIGGGEHRRSEHPVVGGPGLDHDAPAPATGSEQTGGMDQERHRLLGRPIAGGEELLVEVEENHRVDLTELMEGGLGPDHDPGVPGRIRGRRR